MGRFDSLKSNNPFRHAAASGSGSGSNSGANIDDIGPPPGPPPSYSTASTHNNANSSTDYAPPPGPPPSHGVATTTDDTSYIAPPPGPPPSHQPAPQQQQQHDWQSVPLPDDTSSYPPPPDIFTGHDRSWANNATEAQAEEGERWCARYPLLRPLPPSSSSSSSSAGPSRPPPSAYRLVAPRANTFAGTIVPRPGGGGGGGVFTIRTTARSGDSCTTAQPAHYLASSLAASSASRPCGDEKKTAAPAPNPAPTTKTIYFEVRVLADILRDPEVGSVAIGFTALPYPPFRMPGWHRGSLAVHSDDGRRYVNDRWGGVDFVAPWGRRGEVVGVGMRFSRSPSGAGIDAECFFTRDGRLEASWDVNGERDAQRDLEPVGVQGYHDLVAAVGTFQKTEVEVVLDPGKWAYRGLDV